MATLVKHVLNGHLKFLNAGLNIQGCLLQTIRGAKKKAGGAVRNQSGRSRDKKYKHMGAKKLVGDFVEQDMMLYRQLGLKVYPGENVRLGRDNSLFAMEPGFVVVSRERLQPFPNSPLYPSVQAGKVIHKLFYNVIPEPQHNIFKLKSLT